MSHPSRINFGFIVLGVLAAASAASAQTLTVVEPSSHAESRPLSGIRGGNAPVNGPTEIPHHPLPLQANYRNGGGADEEPQPEIGTAVDSVLQTSVGPLINATAGTGFDGMSVYDGGYIPSDNNIAVGPNHIVETVNAAYAVYDKSGHLLLGPNSLRSLWTGLGGQCAANNGGDPIVQYDRTADRWIITQLGSLSSPYAECIAVSDTGNPMGTYHLWAYSFESNLNDYPKFGVWPTTTNSAYLATYNLFANGASFAGAEICAYDREAMIAGDTSPKALCYTNISGASYLPADVDGNTVPLDGTPGYFVDLYSTSGVLGVYKMTPDFASGTATLDSSSISVAAFTQAGSVPQPRTRRTLDSLSDRLMSRLAFRRFSDHESMVVTHSVNTGGVAGARWYELQAAPDSKSANFTRFQQGTFAPGDGVHRWMGSIAMDQTGDIALGYSASNGSSIYPSVRYTGRVPGDAPGTMETEASIIEGSGSQTGYSRWGDYSSMQIDPADDCTFWYVNEYLPTSSRYGWYTRIGSFNFSGCGSTPSADFSLSASPSSRTIALGDSATYTVTVNSLNGFNSAVNLTPSNCPSGASCVFSPISVTPSAGGSADSTLTISGAQPGTYNNITINGNGSVHTTTVSLTVNGLPDFSLSAGSPITVTQGETGTSTIMISSLNGFTGDVTLSVPNCPSNTTCSFSTNPVTGGSGTPTLSIVTTSSSPTGTVELTIHGTDGANSHDTTLSLTINSPSTGFTLDLPPDTTLSLSPRSSGSVIVPVGGSGTVTLSVSGVPQKVSASFSANPVAAPGASTLTLSANPKASKGSSTVTVSGTSGGTTKAVDFTLIIN